MRLHILISLVAVTALLGVSRVSYCQVPEVMVGDTDMIGYTAEPAMPKLCGSSYGPPDLSFSKNVNSDFFYINSSSPTSSKYEIHFACKKTGLQSDSASFIAQWACGAPRNLYIVTDFLEYQFSVNGIDSVITIKTKDKTIIVPIDTINRKYKDDAVPLYFYSNIADPVLFDDWKLDADAAAGIIFSVDSGGSTIFEYSSQPFTRKKQLNFTFSAGLIPTDSARTFQATMKTRVRHGSVDSIYSTPLIFIFPPAPKSDVKRSADNDLDLSVYPNPSSGILTLQLSDIQTEPITIEIFNLLGNKKAIIADNIFVSGEKYLVFDTKILPAGEYFVRASTGRKVLTRKLLVR